MKLLILADDLTGALDTGVQFKKAGADVLVRFDQQAECGEADVLVIDTESRHIAPSLAFERVRAAVSGLGGDVPSCVYKKTDSTLRGNPGAELAALLLASGREALAFVPAFPRMGRTVSGGNMSVFGQMLTTTSFARDPFDPITSDSVADILGAQTDIPVRLLKPGEAPVLNCGRLIMVYDAVTDDDLIKTADALLGHTERLAFAGCAGFAELFAKRLFDSACAQAAPPPKKPELTVCGSINERTLRQLAVAEAAGLPQLLLQPEHYIAHCPDAVIGQIIGAVKGGGLLLKTASCKDDLLAAADAAKKEGITPEALPGRIAKGLGEIVAAALLACPVELLGVIGGDTLFGVMEALGAGSLRPISEEKGVVCSQLMLPGGKRLGLLSKAGSFGDDDAILAMCGPQA